MGLGGGGAEADGHHEVRAVARGGQHALPRRDLVEGALVAREASELGLPHRHDPDHGHGHEEHLRVALGQVPPLPVPLAALQEDAVGVDAVGGLLLGLLLPGHLEVKGQGVDGDGVLPRKVLGRPSGEGLREVDAAEPEEHRDAPIHPSLEESQALDEVVGVAAERLQRGVAVRQPHGRRLAVEDGEEDLLEVLAHEQEAPEGLLDVPEAGLHHGDEAVEARELLHQDRVHRLLIHRGVPLLHLGEAPGLGHALQDVAADLADGILRGGATAG
mmetsp:Transcript_44828/g.142817  ORF Transcript_44828/g.142817 Transcript_44828/m.142817 type:complete len:273 (+) Transcript_44828:297-1115(+)